MAKYYIGFDCGTQGTKTVIYREDGVCMAEALITNEITYPHPGWAELSADNYLEGVREGIRQCLKKSGVDPKEIRSIAGSGVICGLICVDEDMNVLTPYIPYLDVRAEKEAQEFLNDPDPIWIKESGNNVPLIGIPPCVAKWMLNNLEIVHTKGKKFLHNGPFVLARLAGLKAKDAFIDHTTMSGWMMGYVAETKEWSKAQMDKMGIPMEYLPRIVKPWDIIGYLCEEEAAKVGLPAGIPIAAGAGDTMQSNLGSGLTATGQASNVAGTSAVITVMVDGMNDKLRQLGFMYSVGTLENTYFYQATAKAGGLALRWFRDYICDHEGENAYYDVLQAKAEKEPIGSKGVIFLPYLQGGDQAAPNGIGGFLNVTAGTDFGTMWRAVLEGVAFDHKHHFDNFRSCGYKIDTLLITEGGSKSPLWNQIKADILDMKAYTVSNSGGAVMADAVVAAYAVGDIEDIDKTIKSWITIKDEYPANPEATKLYQSIYDKRQALIGGEHMVKVFDALADIRADLSKE